MVKAITSEAEYKSSIEKGAVVVDFFATWYVVFQVWGVGRFANTWAGVDRAS